uniref:NADH dehydrogenase subunit 6 n=1 Tax=Psilochorema bidens TaxID=1968986 RepID=UPI0028D62EC6|nr:NADH dehydrogenase subunit 6 [Psilochorema bidens]WMQ76551.1 NADH dehydrogenase subunit 6 [Psilochorema bidens]
MKLILINLIMTFSFLFIWMNHPLMMGLAMMTQTLLISLLLGLMMSSYWFSYILFITFLGGLLVLYIYVSTLASNEKFNYKFIESMTIMIAMIIISMLISFLFYKNFLSFNLETNEFWQNNLTQNKEIKIMISKCYNNLTMFITFMMMNYLLFTLIVIVKITSLSYGPLRIN